MISHQRPASLRASGSIKALRMPRGLVGSTAGTAVAEDAGDSAPRARRTVPALHRLVPNLVDEVVAFLRNPRQAPDGSPTAAEIARRALLSFDAILRGDRDAAGEGLDAVRQMASEGEAADLLLPPPAGAVRGLSLWLLGRYGEAGEIYDREVAAARERGSRGISP